MSTFYLATCKTCGGTDTGDFLDLLPVPFGSEQARDTWARLHRQATGHEVETSTEVRP